jgi:phage tail sheath protein FI
MAEYLHPGVYIEEIERGPKPIEGVPTSTAAFLGEAERGPTKPRLVTSYKDYRRWFGGVVSTEKYLPYAVNGFFENGGRRMFVCRIASASATTAEAELQGGFIVRAVGPGAWGRSVYAYVAPSSTKRADGTAVGFRLQLAYYAQTPNENPTDWFKDATKPPFPTYWESYDDLVANRASPDYWEKRLFEASALAELKASADANPTPDPTPDAVALTTGGEDGAELTKADYEGRGLPQGRDPQGLEALLLDPYRDVALVYAPAVTYDFAKAIVSHCELLKFRFAVVDCAKSENNPATFQPRNAVADSSYAALYYPWIDVSDPQSGARTLVPPGGYALGIYARTDNERGVFKSPANEIVRGALKLQVETDDKLQDALNPNGVNAIREFPGRGIRVWGARTLSSNALWKYVSVRRLFIFLERSIYEGTQWVVFEPNDDKLWARVIDTIRLFLRTQWRLGALFGRTEEEAFFITCDRTTMTQDDILNGRLICEIGIAPVRPAEFVVFRIFQNTAEPQR